jgi:hypothetical protein
LPLLAQPASPPGPSAAVMAPARTAHGLQHKGRRGSSRNACVGRRRGSWRVDEIGDRGIAMRGCEQHHHSPSLAATGGGAATRACFGTGAAAAMAVSFSNTVFVRNLPFDASDQQARRRSRASRDGVPLRATRRSQRRALTPPAARTCGYAAGSAVCGRRAGAQVLRREGQRCAPHARGAAAAENSCARRRPTRSSR